MANQQNKNIIKNVEEKLRDAEKNIQEEILLNVPNSLTLLRLLLVFVFVYLLFMNFPNWIVFTVFVVAALTDWFDGFFARKLNQKTKIGARMDQVIDRIFTIVIVIALIAYILIHNKPDPENIFSLSSKNIFLLLFLLCSREIIGFWGFLVNLIKNKDPYQVRYIGKLTTFIQSVTLGAILLNTTWSLTLSFYLAIITCFVGIVAGFDYLKYSLS